MFTGIIECLGEIINIERDASNFIFSISSSISNELKIDQSVAHDGVCLTVIYCDANLHKVVAIKETIDRTSLQTWVLGKKINLERCMKLNDRLDGHIVQGHVDGTATVCSIENINGSWNYHFSLTQKEMYNHLMVEKGSICINGVSLTLVMANENLFSVSIIPYTYEHTNFSNLKIGDFVNIEFDIIGKYVQRMMNK